MEEDIVYFTHEEGDTHYVGTAAFINKPDEAAERKASMLAVGVLVPLESGRMGKSWLHAEGLRNLAKGQMRDVSDTKRLEDYWDEHKVEEGKQILPDESTDTLAGKTNGYHKSRAMSAGSAFTHGEVHTLAPHHPAVALMQMLNVFGPLIFPLYRAALLRQRILLVTEAPVEFACNIVYNLSILATLSRETKEYLPRGKVEGGKDRLQALFNIGIQDIDMLKQRSGGWVACTTDDVLATKPELYDIAVYMPGREATKAKEKVYPKIVRSGEDIGKQYVNVGIRASQRDAIRYGGLMEGIKRYPKSTVASDTDKHPEGPVQDVANSTTSSRAPSIHEHKKVVEPPSWAQVAYTSLLWWASSGDQPNGFNEEREAEIEQDAMLLDTDDSDEDGRTKEVAVVGYFRRLTAVMFGAVNDVLRQEEDGEDAVEGDGEDDDDGHDGSSDEIQDRNRKQQAEAEHAVEHHHQPSFDEDNRPLLVKAKKALMPDADEDVLSFTSEDVSAMGLDVWSKGDRDFIEDFVSTWWNRKAKITGGRVECCGMRIL